MGCPFAKYWIYYTFRKSHERHLTVQAGNRYRVKSQVPSASFCVRVYIYIYIYIYIYTHIYVYIYALSTWVTPSFRWMFLWRRRSSVSVWRWHFYISRLINRIICVISSGLWFDGHFSPFKIFRLRVYEFLELSLQMYFLPCWLCFTHDRACVTLMHTLLWRFCKY